jgi:hypothetical protein
MACMGCGATIPDAIFGACLRCTVSAGISAGLLWTLYMLSASYAVSQFIVWPLLGFAMLVTLMLLAHVAGHISNFLRLR